jgi:SAM-dependent methyltransferase
MKDPLIPKNVEEFEGLSAEAYVNMGIGFFHNMLHSRVGLLPHEAVLDIGSGDAKMARPLTTYLTTGRYRGLDAMKHYIDWSNEAYAPYQNFGFDWANVRSDWYNKDAPTQAHEYTFPYETATFDVAFAISLATHLLPDGLERYMQETFRVLKPGGRFFCTFFVLNDETREIALAQKAKIPFTRVSKIHAQWSVENPSKAVAYEEIWLRRMLATSFVLTESYWGTWATGVNRLGIFQDAMLLIKRG